MLKRILLVGLLIASVSAHATIYQCGSLFQGHPCSGAVVRSGAPSTYNDESGTRFSAMEAQHQARVEEREQQRAEQARLAISIEEARARIHQEETAPAPMSPVPNGDYYGARSTGNSTRINDEMMARHQQQLQDQNREENRQIEHNIDPDVSLNPNW